VGGRIISFNKNSALRPLRKSDDSDSDCQANDQQAEMALAFYLGDGVARRLTRLC
jgi:hypothetical protein